MEAIVMDCNGKNAVVLKKDGTFLTVRDASYTIGQRIENAGMKRTGLGQLAVAACLCLVIGLGAVGAKLWLTPYSHVEVRAEYSVGLTLNRFQYVIDTEVESDEDAVWPEGLEQEVVSQDAVKKSGMEDSGVVDSETSQVQASYNIRQAELTFVGTEGAEETAEEKIVLEVLENVEVTDLTKEPDMVETLEEPDKSGTSEVVDVSENLEESDGLGRSEVMDFQ